MIAKLAPEVYSQKAHFVFQAFFLYIFNANLLQMTRDFVSRLQSRFFFFGSSFRLYFVLAQVLLLFKSIIFFVGYFHSV